MASLGVMGGLSVSGCVMGGLSVSESVQRESEQLANEGTSANARWKVVSIYFCVFYWYFWRAEEQCYLSVQVTVLLEKSCVKIWFELVEPFKRIGGI